MHENRRRVLESSLQAENSKLTKPVLQKRFKPQSD
jgi:hypothetical protein